MINNNTNPLSAEFLYELYATVVRNDMLCGVIVENMRKEFLPDRAFQRVQDVICVHFKNYKKAPTFPVLSQALMGDADAMELVNTFMEYDGDSNSEMILDMLETYIKGVRLQQVYGEVGKMYNSNQQKKAEELLQEYAMWLSSFTLKDSAFIDVMSTFSERLRRNKVKTSKVDGEEKENVARFYIPIVDALNNGRSLRGQLTCFLASTGVGKSHIVKHIGVRAAIEDGLHILHFQLEGSEEEALNAYSGGIIARNAYTFEKGNLSDREIANYEQSVREIAGSVSVRCFPRFNTRVSTLDIKNGIAEYRKKNMRQPDIVIIDSMDLLTDSSRKSWGAEHERGKRIAVANDLKDLASDEDIWMVVTYQATIENRDWLNNDKNVLTEYNCSEAKGLSRPCTHLISLNQTSLERVHNEMRIHIAKARFFKKGATIRIATDYDNEVFCDMDKTLTLNPQGDECDFS